MLRLQVNEAEVGLSDISAVINNKVCFSFLQLDLCNFLSTILKTFHFNISIVNKLSCLSCCYRDIMVQLPSPGRYQVFF